MQSFQDYFSKQAAVYSKFRPSYPSELFEFLKGLTNEHQLAWDCGTGNGQSAIELAKIYEQVFATDPSSEQIKNAFPHHSIVYKVEAAETPHFINDHSVDLITVAQAVHWFDLDKFYTQAKRVLKLSGVIAIWAYNLPIIEPKIDSIIQDFHDNVVGEFWLPENKLIDSEYSTISFPFCEINTPEFFIRKQTTLYDTIGHIRSWSATQKFIDKHRFSPIDAVTTRIKEHWEDPYQQKETSWKLILKVGKNT